MTTEAKAGSLKVVNSHILHSVFAAIFILGVFLGAYGMHSTFATPTTVARPLIEVGEYLCREWSGLAEIGRVSKKHYAFRCHSLAMFPEVEVTIEKEQKPAVIEESRK